MYCTPDWHDWFWSRGMEYIKWMNGGAKVEPQTFSHVIAFTLGSKTFKADGQPLPMTVEPTIISGRTYIPARYLVEPIGGDVGWEQTTKTITMTALNHQIKLTIGNKKCKKDGKDIDMDDSPVIVSGRTLIPLRAASTLIDAAIDWNQTTRTATITVVTNIKY
jgi:trimeric autotransporter adhesin